MNLWSPKTVLALAPHRDDYELGAGGTIARLLESGAAVHGLIFSLARIYPVEEFDPKNYMREAVAGAQKLGLSSRQVSILDLPIHRLPEHRQEILQTLVDLKAALDPDLILCPCRQDIHQDHATVTTEAIRAFKDRTILGYQMPWNNLEASYDLCVALEKRHIETKLEAISAYESQNYRTYCQPPYAWGLAIVGGQQINREYAEVYEVIRWVIR